MAEFNGEKVLEVVNFTLIIEDDDKIGSSCLKNLSMTIEHIFFGSEWVGECLNKDFIKEVIA